eukprot:5959911-Amphidinium_carterae.1
MSILFAHAMGSGWAKLQKIFHASIEERVQRAREEVLVGQHASYSVDGSSSRKFPLKKCRLSMLQDGKGQR